jgi:hypothetical protein
MMSHSNEIVANIVGKSATNYISLQDAANGLGFSACQLPDYQSGNFPAHHCLIFHIHLSPF